MLPRHFAFLPCYVALAATLILGGCMPPPPAFRLLGLDYKRINWTTWAQKYEDELSPQLDRLKQEGMLYSVSRVDMIARNLEKYLNEGPYAQYNVFVDKTLDATVVAGTYGGQDIFISEHALDLFDNDDEIAFILGHEIGHVARYHQLERIDMDMSLSDLLYWPAVKPRMEYYWSRSDEIEADRFAMNLCARAGYDPTAAVALRRRLDRIDLAPRYRGLDSLAEDYVYLKFRTRGNQR